MLTKFSEIMQNMQWNHLFWKQSHMSRTFEFNLLEIPMARDRI